MLSVFQKFIQFRRGSKDLHLIPVTVLSKTESRPFCLFLCKYKDTHLLNLINEVILTRLLRTFNWSV